MGKKKKNKTTFPKKVLGVKIPKQFREFADTPIGSAIIAESIVRGAFELAHSNRVQKAAGNAAGEVAHAGTASGGFLATLLGTALSPVVAAAHEIVEKAGAHERIGSNDYTPGGLDLTGGEEKKEKAKAKDKDKKKAKAKGSGKKKKDKDDSEKKAA